MRGDGAEPRALSDTPLLDRLWGGLSAWLRGNLAVSGAALTVAATLGWPRRAAAALTGSQIAWLSAQALASSVVLGRGGRRLCRRYPGTLVVACVAGVPAALALLMTWEWHDPREPLASWTRLLTASVQLAALEAGPVGYLLWRLHQRQPARQQAGETPEEPRIT
jgi:hypothetical protein